jgi:hypothetical protein
VLFRSNGTTSVNIVPTANDTVTSGGLPTISINGANVTSGGTRALTIGVGNIPVTVVVTAGDGITTNIYKLTITRAS